MMITTKTTNRPSDWRVGEYIVYRNGENYEIGRIKSLREDGAFVAYHEGETGAKTPWDCMHKLQNAYVIKKTTLAWEYFDDAVIPVGEYRLTDMDDDHNEGEEE